MTYPLHVILRYRLEKALIAGDLEVADLPGAWNEGMRELLGVTPPDDRLGCLQDIHWPVGAFGYFPCYTLGAMLAAQLFEAASAAEPEIARRASAAAISRRCWPGCARTSTGRAPARDAGAAHAGHRRPARAEPFLRHLETRYLTLSAAP